MKRLGLVLVLATVSSTPALSKSSKKADAAASPEAAIKAARSSIGQGYLKPQMVPDSFMMLPPPPAPGSAALARDEEAAKAAVALRGSARWVQATADAEILTAAATGAMSCAAGFVIGEKETPAIQKLLRRSMADLGLSGYAAKRKYQRPRPFMANGEPNCTPGWDAILRKDGSYPSGHSAVGYGWGLILAEIVPDRTAQLVSRGRAYGESRRICNVHWLSDVEEGRVTATAVIARLHADPAFQKDMKAAKAEAKKLGAKAIKPDCAKENEALSNAN
jgi:acid phosphatase (class A)